MTKQTRNTMPPHSKTLHEFVDCLVSYDSLKEGHDGAKQQILAECAAIFMLKLMRKTSWRPSPEIRSDINDLQLAKHKINPNIASQILQKIDQSIELSEVEKTRITATIYREIMQNLLAHSPHLTKEQYDQLKTIMHTV